MSKAEACAYSVEEVRKILPHRFPFALIDRVIEVGEGTDPTSRVGRSAKVIKNVSVNENFFQGHFPDKPIMPGVLLIEAMAQAGGVACYTPGDKPMNIMIAGVNRARFRKPVVPGDQVILMASVKKDRTTMFVLDCQAYVDDQLVAEAEILAYVASI